MAVQTSELESEDKYARDLAENGVVIIEDYLSPETCDELREKLIEAIEQGAFTESESGWDAETMATHEDPIVNRRKGDDEGTLDIFNIDEVVPEFRDIKNDQFKLDIINKAAGTEYSQNNINAYVKESVTDVYDYHADTFSAKFKSFVYLTDVPDRSHGPFSYIPGSHQPGPIEVKATVLANKAMGRPPQQAVFYRKSQAIHCTAPKGTLIIGDQTGYHRGDPQDPGYERILATTMYTPKGQDLY